MHTLRTFQLDYRYESHRISLSVSNTIAHAEKVELAWMFAKPLTKRHTILQKEACIVFVGRRVIQSSLT
jgi:hypothetical protein